ncbi:MAG: type II toxin-antitoxin system RelB/DinJ family antitoxin [Defluviitaleaceae bacterium]|nr:type II toxin-antitoxin system RelB/DinJ family antitoxin [Defluviitaleaceae bacterium]
MAQITITMEDSLKEKAEIFLNELGFDFSSVFNVLIKQALREKRIPFDIELRSFDEDEQMITKEVLLQQAKEAEAFYLAMRNNKVNDND